MSFAPEYLAEDRGPSIIISNAIATGVAVLVVAVRVTSRFAVLKKLEYDDWFLVVATLLAASNVVVTSQSVRLGTGRHLQAVPESNVILEGVYRFITRVLYFLILGIIKLSICFLYLKIFPNIRIATFVLIAVISGATTAQVVATVFTCVPVPSLWDAAAYPNAICINNIAFQYTTAALSVITDLWAVVLPFPTICSLQVPMRKKLTLIGLFSIRMLACIACLIRMGFLVTLLRSDDPTWDTYGTSIVSGCEIAVSIITASIPNLKPVFNKIFPDTFPWTRAGSLGTQEMVLEIGSLGDAKQALNNLGRGSESEAGDIDSAIDLSFGFNFGFSDPER